MLKHNRIFHNGTGYLKDPGFYKSLTISESLISTIEPQDHRIRRQKISSLFSTKAIDTMAPQILTIAQKAAERVTERGREQKPIDLHRLCRSFSVSHLCPSFGITLFPFLFPMWDMILIIEWQSEVLFKILFGQPSHLLDSQEEHPELLKSIDAFLGHIWISELLHSLPRLFISTLGLLLASLSNFCALITVKSFPIVAWLALNMPQSLAQKVVPGFKNLKDVNMLHFILSALTFFLTFPTYLHPRPTSYSIPFLPGLREMGKNGSCPSNFSPSRRQWPFVKYHIRSHPCSQHQQRPLPAHHTRVGRWGAHVCISRDRHYGKYNCKCFLLHPLLSYHLSQTTQRTWR